MRAAVTCRASWLAQERAGLGCPVRPVPSMSSPPEVLSGRCDGTGVIQSSIGGRDSWTLGMALYIMLTGKTTMRLQ